MEEGDETCRSVIIDLGKKLIASILIQRVLHAVLVGLTDNGDRESVSLSIDREDSGETVEGYVVEILDEVFGVGIVCIDGESRIVGIERLREVDTVA